MEKNFDFYIDKLTKDVDSGVKVKYGKGRIRIFNIALLVIISSLLTLTMVTFGQFLIVAPIVFIIQIIGSFIALWMSRITVKKDHNIYLIGHGRFNNEREEKLYHVVELIAVKLNLKRMPEVAIYMSNDLNAFATGPSRRRSLIAFSSRSLHEETDESLVATAAHELAHIANGDMVGQTFIGGLITTIMFILTIPIKIAGWAIACVYDSWISDAIYVVSSIILDWVFFSISKLIMLAYSRRREFRADELAAKLVGKDAMVNCLEFLKGYYFPKIKGDAYATIKFHSTKNVMDIFSTHPSLDRRINKLNKKFR